MELKDILLGYANEGVNAELILDSEIAYEVYLDLLEEGVEFFNESEDPEEIFGQESFVGIAVSFFEGEEDWFVQEVVTEDGETLRDDVTDVLFVQSDLVDCIDVSKYEAESKFELVLEEEEEVDLDDLADEILERLANSSCIKCEMVDILEELID